MYKEKYEQQSFIYKCLKFSIYEYVYISLAVALKSCLNFQLPNEKSCQLSKK